MFVIFDMLHYVNVACRFCNPLETSSSSQADSQPLRDFEFARQELAAKQNARYVHFLHVCVLTNA